MWFVEYFTHKKTLLRRKYKSLSYWEKILATVIRFKYIIFKNDEKHHVKCASPDSWNPFGGAPLGLLRFKNLPSVLRTLCRRIKERFPLCEHGEPYTSKGRADTAPDQRVVSLSSNSGDSDHDSNQGYGYGLNVPDFDYSRYSAADSQHSDYGDESD